MEKITSCVLVKVESGKVTALSQLCELWMYMTVFLYVYRADFILFIERLMVFPLHNQFYLQKPGKQPHFLHNIGPILQEHDDS